MTVVITLAVLGGCVAVGFPPAPVGTHTFERDGREIDFRLVEPMSPIWTFFQQPPPEAPEAVQISPDGRTMYALFEEGSCRGLKSISVERPSAGVLAVSVQVVVALPPGPCPAAVVFAATRTLLEPPVDPRTVTVVGPDGSEVPVDPYAQ